MPYIKRDADKVIHDWYKSSKKALMIFGARQIGKTESIKEFLRNIYKIKDDDLLPHIDIENMPLVRENIISGISEGGPSFIRNIFANAGKRADLDKCNIIFIDEVQSLSKSKKARSQEEIREILSRLMLEKEFRFIFSGSLLGAKIYDFQELIKKLPFEVALYHMYPISYCEFIEERDGSRKDIELAKQKMLQSKTIPVDIHVKLLTRFIEYCYVGGMPKSEIAYFDNDKFSVAESLDAISSLSNQYVQDISKYYREELNMEAGNDLIEQLLLGIKHNDKLDLMKRFRADPSKTLYQFLIDSDVGLVVSHIEEYNKPISIQTKPKTYFNDAGFMVYLIEERLQKYPEYKDIPAELKDFYHSKSIDNVKDEFIKYVNNEGGTKPIGIGYVFEQVIAQNLKSNLYNYAYKYQDNPEMELEFIIPDDSSAIEVKSGGFGKCSSSLNYARAGNKVYFLSMLPYVCEGEKNIFLFPVYSVCILKQDEISSINLKESNDGVKEIFASRILPKTKGFY